MRGGRLKVSGHLIIHTRRLAMHMSDGAVNDYHMAKMSVDSDRLCPRDGL